MTPHPTTSRSLLPRQALSKRLARALGATLVASLLAATAVAQPTKSTQPPPGKAPTAAPTSAAAPSGPASSGPSPTLPPGHPPTGDAPPAPPATGDLPPGHPPTGTMPPGHPPTGADGAPGDGDPDANPHGGGMPTNPTANPRGGGARGQMFDAPPDTAEDDATLPLGTIVLTLKDAQEKPIPAADVALAIVHNTVAAGESRERKNGTTDAEGTIRWDGLPRGSGTSFRATVVNNKATFGTEPFSLGDRVGKRVLLHVYGATPNIEETLVGAQGLVYLSLREDSITFENMYGIFNLGQVAWVPENETIELPEGYKAFNRPDAMDGVGIDEVNGKGIFRGTIGPGRHDVQFRYQVDLDGSERQTFKLALPPHIAQMRVMVESSKTMGVEVPGFPAARKSRNRDGKRVLVTEKMVAREQGGLKTVEITLTGLPTAGPGRWIAALLGIAAVVAGFAYVQQRRSQKGPDDEMRADLIDAREALLREIVELERAHRSGEIGDKTFARLRNALVDALERLMTKIAEATPKKKRQSRVADEAEA